MKKILSPKQLERKYLLKTIWIIVKATTAVVGAALIYSADAVPSIIKVIISSAFAFITWMAFLMVDIQDLQRQIKEETKEIENDIRMSNIQ